MDRKAMISFPQIGQFAAEPKFPSSELLGGRQANDSEGDGPGSPAMISANEKTRIVTLLMRAGCELGLKFDDGFWAAPRFAAFAAPSWNEAA